MVKWLHNNVPSNEILIIVEAGLDMPNCKDKILQTLLHRFPLNHKGDRYGKFDFNVVSNLTSDDSDEEDNYPHSKLFIAVHTSQGSCDGIDGVLVTEDCPVPHTWATQVILDHLNVARRPEILQLSKTLTTRLPPDAIDRICFYLDPEHFRNSVKKVGISGVSSEYMSDMWRDIISKPSQYMDEDGGGYMLHQMWKWFGYKVGWCTVREKSYHFSGRGWELYNLFMHVHHRDD
jgi:hypothetical protein